MDCDKPPYTIKQIKQVITDFIHIGDEPELSIFFEDKMDEYMIIGYLGHVSFQRCGTEETGSGEYNYPDLDTLFSAELLDGICLTRDWHKVSDIGCQPGLEYYDPGTEAYKELTEAYKKLTKQYRIRKHIYQFVKKQIALWQPERFLPKKPEYGYFMEIEEAAAHIRPDQTTEQIAKAVFYAFAASFGRDALTLEECRHVAAGIKRELTACPCTL